MVRAVYFTGIWRVEVKKEGDIVGRADGMMVGSCERSPNESITRFQHHHSRIYSIVAQTMLCHESLISVKDNLV